MSPKQQSPDALLKNVFPPMLASLTEAPPVGASWAFELKYDGFRGVAAIVEGNVAIRSRNELNLAPRFPSVAAALSKLKLPEVVLDGEIVVLDEQGAPRFQLLQQGGRELFVVFDILWLDGQDLRRLTYEERRALLVKALRRAPAAIKVAEQLEGTGAAALQGARESGWEGIIAKRRTSVYEGRRSKEWLKIKAINEQELIVVGWNPSTHSERVIGALHLAVMDGDGELRYAGKVGTGFSFKQRVWWKDELSKDVVPKTMVKDAPRERVATWVRPRFVVQVSFTEWTADNRLRHPSFKGIREDKKVGDVVREKPVPVSKIGSPAVEKKSAAAAKKVSSKKAASSKKSASPKSSSSKPAAPTTPVNLTHPERVLYPRDGITKQDVADYYAAMAEPMLRALRDRPLALEHWNDGIDKPSWFHQDVGRGAPPWVASIDTPTRTTSKSVRHLVVDRPETLRWLAQMSVLTIHMWASRGASPEEPDWLVFDLDPAKGKGIEQAIDAAIIIRRLLDNLRLPSLPKTSGKRGIHVLIPLVGGYSHEDANEFACSIGAAVASKVPEFTMERALNKRHGRLYLDCMQNAYGKTIVAPYSLRAIDGAPVSAPLKWEEVTKKLDPKKFNLRTMPARLAKVGDLFARVFEDRVKLPELK
ncbi:MAG: bifunctional non-ous end joining protein LigD [Thermoanaerobaculia bacterium]|jgi:bifunctional non-homologous end joining protein LigD|nr:bifunctional non-ous end joining protein LigD [Thermoanaerobaculia bacterium]